MLPQIVTKEVAKETAAITIFLGANDSNNEQNTRQHVPLAEYRDGLTSMVEHLLVRKAVSVLSLRMNFCCPFFLYFLCTMFDISINNLEHSFWHRKKPLRFDKVLKHFF